MDPLERRCAEFVRGLLWGTLGTAELTRDASAYGIDPGREYLAVRARPAPGRTIAELAQAHGFTSEPTDPTRPSGAAGRAVVVGGDLVGFVAAAPPGGVPGVSGLGPARPLDRLAESFRMASRALDTADRRNLTGVHEFGRLGPLPAVYSDDAVGAALHRRYLAPLGDTEFAAEIIDTLRVYLVAHLHVGKTAELTSVHPNTVRYRISRFEDLTGVSLRSCPVVAFEVFWALEHAATRPDPGRS